MSRRRRRHRPLEECTRSEYIAGLRRAVRLIDERDMTTASKTVPVTLRASNCAQFKRLNFVLTRARAFVQRLEAIKAKASREMCVTYRRPVADKRQVFRNIENVYTEPPPSDDPQTTSWDHSIYLRELPSGECISPDDIPFVENAGRESEPYSVYIDRIIMYTPKKARDYVRKRMACLERWNRRIANDMTDDMYLQLHIQHFLGSYTVFRDDEDVQPEPDYLQE